MNDVLSRAEIYPRLSRVHTYDDGNAIADETARSVYKRNLVALRSYADGVAVVKICDAFGASRQRLNQLVKRHERLGRKGLLRYAQSGEREVNVDLHVSATPLPNAMAAVWAKYPQVFQNIKTVIDEERLPTEKKSKGELSISELLVYLNDELDAARKPRIEQGLEAEDRWRREFPANSPDGGRRAMKRLAGAVREGRRLRNRRMEEEETERRLAEFEVLKSNRFYGSVEMDGHAVDCNWAVEMLSPTGTGLVWVEVTRFYVVPVIESKGGACLGWSYSLDPKNYPAETMCAATRNALVPWKPRKLTLEGVTYKMGECMPNAYIPLLAWRAWDQLDLDNAKAHLADMFLTSLEQSVGCVVHFGPASAPNVRPKIEKIFDLLEEAGIHPIPASDGSSTVGLSLDEKKKARYHLKLDALLDLVDLLFCRWNASCPPDSNETRLAMLKRDVMDSKCYPRYIPQSERERLQRYDIRLIRRIGNRKGHPVLRLDADYDGGRLNEIPNLIGKYVYVDIDSTDVRRVRVYLMETGEDLGELIVEKRYRDVAHSFTTRKHAKAVSKHNRFSSNTGDLLTAARRHSFAQVERGNKRHAAAVARAVTEMINGVNVALANGTGQADGALNQTSMSGQVPALAAPVAPQAPASAAPPKHDGGVIANRKMTAAEKADFDSLGAVY